MGIVKFLFNTILYLATALLILIAIVVSAVRYYPNISDIVERKIETRLGDILNADIVIESLDIHRRDMPPRIIAQNVTITNRDNPEQSWSIKKALVGINVTGSLLSGALRVKEVGLEGLDISVHRDRAGDFHINQLFLVPQSSVQSSGAGAYNNVHLHLLDTNLRWRDEITDVDYLFEQIDIAIDPNFRGYHIYLAGNLPAKLGKSIRAHLQVTGNMRVLQETNIKFYVQTDQLRLAEIAKRFVGASGEKVPVILQAETWGEIDNLTLRSLRGSIDANNLAVAADEAGKQLCLSDDYMRQISMQFNWDYQEDSWSFDANNIRIVTAKHDWPETEMHFKTVEHSLNAKSVFAHIGSMDIGSICNTLRSYSPHIVRFENQLEQYRMNARFEDLLIRFDLGEEHQTSFQYSAKVDAAALWIAEGNRMIRGVGGSVLGGDSGGKVTLNSDAIAITLPQLYPGQQLSFGAEGEVQWLQTGDHLKVNSEYLKLFNNDLELNARLHTDVIGSEVYIDSQIHIPTAKANAIGSYFPVHKRTIKTKKWLSEAVQSGEVADATVLMRGNLREFPYHQESGVFEAAIRVENGTLEYKRDWPILTDVDADVYLKKQRIEVKSQQARMFDSKIKDVDIYIESFLRSVLNVHGVADGSASDLLKFLGESGLVSKQSPILNNISMGGDMRLVLDFSRSLSKKVDHPFQVSGDIHFLGNQLDIHSVGIHLDDLGGEIAFNADGASGKDITAVLMGNAVNLAAEPAGNGATFISFNGPFDVGTYIQQRYPKFDGLVNGVTQAKGIFRLPSLFKKENKEKVRLQVESQLVGVNTNLPEPLLKDIETILPSKLLFDDGQQLMHWQFGKLLSLRFNKTAQKKFQLNHIGLGDVAEVEGDSEGLLVQGVVDTLPVTPWLNLHKQYFTSQDEQDKSSGMPTIDVSIETLQWPTWPAEQVTLQGFNRDDVYVVDVNSSLGDGSIKIPQAKQLPVTLDVQSLVLAKPEQKTELQIDPRTLRPFSFRAQQLTLNNLNLKNVGVQGSTNEDGLSFDQIRFEAQDLKVNGSGIWQVVNADEQQSVFNLQLASIDVEDSLEDLGFSSALRKGELNSDIEINWMGAPYQYSLVNMQGSATLDMRDGVVKEVEPGAGRLLALLNLGAISRRLSLDFTDVTKKGFTFDSIKGRLHLQPSGIMQTDKIAIKSSAADIDINGHTNLIDRTYDQTILMTPNVTGTLPAVGAVAGPVGVGVGIIVDKAAKVVGLDKVVQAEYKMTGTWEQPKLTRVKRKLDKQASAAQPELNDQQTATKSAEATE